jgi:hypothetical protein
MTGHDLFCFAYNASRWIRWISIPCVIITLGFTIGWGINKTNYKVDSDKWLLSHYYMKVASAFLAFFVILFIASASMPVPDHDIVYRDRIVTQVRTIPLQTVYRDRIVNRFRPHPYQELFNSCQGNYGIIQSDHTPDGGTGAWIRNLRIQECAGIARAEAAIEIRETIH